MLDDGVLKRQIVAMLPEFWFFLFGQYADLCVFGKICKQYWTTDRLSCSPR